MVESVRDDTFSGTFDHRLGGGAVSTRYGLARFLQARAVLALALRVQTNARVVFDGLQTLHAPDTDARINDAALRCQEVLDATDPNRSRTSRPWEYPTMYSGLALAIPHNHQLLGLFVEIILRHHIP